MRARSCRRTKRDKVRPDSCLGAVKNTVGMYAKENMWAGVMHQTSRFRSSFEGVHLES